jgi:hypothetical protein
MAFSISQFSFAYDAGVTSRKAMMMRSEEAVESEPAMLY